MIVKIVVELAILTVAVVAAAVAMPAPLPVVAFVAAHLQPTFQRHLLAFVEILCCKFSSLIQKRTGLIGEFLGTEEKAELLDAIVDYINDCDTHFTSEMARLLFYILISDHDEMVEEFFGVHNYLRHPAPLPVVSIIAAHLQPTFQRHLLTFVEILCTGTKTIC